MYDHVKYTRLTPHTYTAWEEVERESGIQLVHKCGGVYWARKGHGREEALMANVDAMKAVGMGSKCIKMTPEEAHKRWPQFLFPNDSIIYFDPDSGLVDPIMGNACHQQLAKAHGATVLAETKVLQVKSIGADKVEVTTDRGIFTGRKLIVCAGAWINRVLGGLGVTVPVQVNQEQVTYFATPHLKEFTKENHPIHFFFDRRHDFYALPIHGIAGYKIGIDAGGPAVTAETRNYTPDPVREQFCVDYLKQYIPRALGDIMLTKTCLYTMTLDRTFVIDTLKTRNHPNVIVCCGAGHAFKFASLFGQILADLAVKGRTTHDLSEFRLERPAITDPNFKPQFDLFVTTGESVHDSAAKL